MNEWKTNYWTLYVKLEFLQTPNIRGSIYVSYRGFPNVASNWQAVVLQSKSEAMVAKC